MKASWIGWMMLVGFAALLPQALAGQQSDWVRSAQSILIRQPATFSGSGLNLSRVGSPADAAIPLRHPEFNPHALPTQRVRPWWIFPAVGAGAGAVIMGYRMSQETAECTDPIGCLVGPPLMGAMVGGAAGGLVEWITRMFEDAQASERVRSSEG
jgi:hypothetical protein